MSRRPQPGRLVSAYPHRVPRLAPEVVGSGPSVAVHGAERTRSVPARRSRHHVVPVVGAALLVVVLVATLPHAFASGNSFQVPSSTTLANLSVPQRIVAVAQSQVGYSTNPSDSYCNKFSAYWNAGSSVCPSGERSEQWCADFAAWVWHEAGVPLTYGYGTDQINGAAASFYEWAVANGAWHLASNGYVAEAGDVALYGLSLEGPTPSAAHVAVVTDDSSGQAGPDVVNGDGDRTGFSVVETGNDQVQADVGQNDSALDGYVSPP